MLKIKKKQKVALLVIEGLGVSTKKGISPFLPSNSGNIKEVFESFEKKILKTKDDSIKNRYLENDIPSLLNTFSSSKRALSPELQLSKNSNQFKDKLEKSLYNCKNHQSSLHIFLIYSKNHNIFNQEIFDRTIDEIKKYDINKVYLHLFCDYGVKPYQTKEFIDNFNQINGNKFQVSTISGVSNLTSKRVKDHLDIYKTVINGKNRQILDISNIGDGDYTHLLPHKFIKNRNPIGLISDFDTVLFLNIKTEIFSDLIFLLNKNIPTFY